jgi:hypothetical protein
VDETGYGDESWGNESNGFGVHGKIDLNIIVVVLDELFENNPSGVWFGWP